MAIVVAVIIFIVAFAVIACVLVALIQIVLELLYRLTVAVAAGLFVLTASIFAGVDDGSTVILTLAAAVIGFIAMHRRRIRTQRQIAPRKIAPARQERPALPPVKWPAADADVGQAWGRIAGRGRGSAQELREAEENCARFLHLVDTDEAGKMDFVALELAAMIRRHVPDLEKELPAAVLSPDEQQLLAEASKSLTMMAEEARRIMASHQEVRNEAVRLRTGHIAQRIATLRSKRGEEQA